jgi:pyrroline-5-carboxylate reductase
LLGLTTKDNPFFQTLMRIAYIGGGNMGGALLRAQQRFLPDSSALLIEPDSAKRERLAHETGCEALAQPSAALRHADWLVLAVKPQVAVEVLRGLQEWGHPEQLVLSVMAGVSLDTLSRELPHRRLVRVMPNTPALVEQGMTVFHVAPEVSAAERDQVKNFLGALGQCLEVSGEETIDAATAVSGSGPAYVFYFAEHLMAAAQGLGFTPGDSRLLVEQTLQGALQLWKQSGLEAGELRRQVTSPGGTTEAALKHFESSEVGPQLQEGVRQAYRRARELAG